MTNVVSISPDASRPLPHNAAAEQTLLGGILLNNALYDRVVQILRPEHFFYQIHQRVYERIGELIAAGRTASQVVLVPDFENDPAVVEHGGASRYLASLSKNATMMVDAASVAETIRDLSVRRALLEATTAVAARVHGAQVHESAALLLDEAETILGQVRGPGLDILGRTVPLHEAGQEVLVQINAAIERGTPPGLQTGLDDFDRVTGGLHASDLVILAGRPSMGKSALGMSIARRLARRGYGVALYSLEMDRMQVAQRMLAEETGIAYRLMRNGDLDLDAFNEIAAKQAEHASLGLWICDRGQQTVATMKADIRRLRRRHDIHAVVVDYLQLLRGSGRYEGDRTREVTEITSDLKAMAKDFGVCVLALAQLNRGVEGRDDKRPRLSDLRESGSIEQDADAVLFAYRREYYLERAEPENANSPEHLKWEAEMSEARGQFDVIVGKQRHGPLGVVTLQCDLATNTFNNHHKAA